MNTKIDCHGPVSSSTWPTPGAMMGMAMRDHEDQRHDLGHVAARRKRSRTTAVATTRVAAAPGLRQAESEEDCEIRREGRGGAGDADAQPEQQRDAAAEAVGQRPERLREAEAEHVGADHQLPLVFV